MKSKTMFGISLALMLTGCSHMQGEFDCPVGKGVSCQSMKTVDHLASQGYFKDNPSPQWKINVHFDKKRRNQVLKRNTLSLQAPHRVPERILKIWFAPFVDSADHYHHESEVYAVMEKSFWGSI